MIVNLHKNQPEQLLKFKKGDTLCFTDGDSWDYYLVAYNTNSNNYCLVSLINSLIREEFTSIENMVEDLNNTRNGFALKKVLKHNEVMLSGVAND